MARPTIGERAMTGAERVDRWRKRHARKLAREAGGKAVKDRLLLKALRLQRPGRAGARYSSHLMR